MQTKEIKIKQNKKKQEIDEIHSKDSLINSRNV